MRYSMLTLRRMAWHELAEADGQRIAVARHADVGQLAVGRVGALAIEGMRPCTELKPCAPLTK